MRLTWPFWFFLLMGISLPTWAEPERSCSYTESIVRFFRDLGPLHGSQQVRSFSEMVHAVAKAEPSLFLSNRPKLQSSGIRGSLTFLGSLKWANEVFDVDLALFVNQDFFYASILKDAGSHTMVWVVDGFHILVRGTSEASVFRLSEELRQGFPMNYFAPTQVGALSPNPTIHYPYAVLATPDSFFDFLERNQRLLGGTLPRLDAQAREASNREMNPDTFRTLMSMVPVSRGQLESMADSNSRTFGGTVYYFRSGSLIGYCQRGTCKMIKRVSDVGSHAAILRTQGIDVSFRDSDSAIFEKSRERTANFLKELALDPTASVRDHWEIWVLEQALANHFRKPAVLEVPPVMADVRSKLEQLLRWRRNYLIRGQEALVAQGKDWPLIKSVHIQPTRDDLPVEPHKLYRFVMIDTNPPTLILTRGNVLHDQMIQISLGTSLVSEFIQTGAGSEMIFRFLRGGAFTLTQEGNGFRVRLIQDFMTVPGKTLHWATGDTQYFLGAVARYLGVSPSQVQVDG